MATLQLDVEAVSAAVNRIDTLTTDIKTRTDKFLALVEEKNEESHKRFPLIQQLQVKLQEETKNIEQVVAAQEDIKAALSRYADQLEEASNADVFK